VAANIPPFKTVELVATPDSPRSFGRKMLWIATRAPTSVSLAETLGLIDAQPANWASGIAAAYTWPSDYVFVTPPIDGWVLAAGFGLPDPSDRAALPRWRALMSAVSARYGNAQYFGSHRGFSYTVWARYDQGIERRLFAYADEPIYDIGERRLTSSLLSPTSSTPGAPKRSRKAIGTVRICGTLTKTIP
jgi:hypothetical protein